MLYTFPHSLTEVGTATCCQAVCSAIAVVRFYWGDEMLRVTNVQVPIGLPTALLRLLGTTGSTLETSRISQGKVFPLHFSVSYMKVKS